MDNKNQPNDNSSQNELDLGFNHSDSVTPRKPVQQSGSIFDKAKGLFGKKEQPDTQFHVRREPTFGAAASQPFSPSQAFQSEILNSQCNQVLSELKNLLKMFK